MATDPQTFDPLSESFARDPYPAYAGLRAAGAPVWYAPFDIWLLPRFDQVQAAVMNPLSLRSLDHLMTADEMAQERRAQNWHDMPAHSRFVQFSMLNSDGEVHQRLRKRLFREFTPARIERFREGVEAYVDTLFDQVGPEFDFIEDVAAHLPGLIIGRFLGVPDADCAQLRQWSEDIVQYFDIDRSNARKALAERTTQTFYDYLLDLTERRRREPQPDLISSLLADYDSGAMSEDEYFSTCMLILMAGHGSTIDALGNGLHALMTFPEQMQRLRDDSALMPTAVQEMFRYDAPLPFFHRYASEAIEVCGHRFNKGAKVGLLYGSANRDPDALAEADRFDVGRTPNRHLSFAAGPHFCLGNHLARLSMESVFTALLRRYPHIERAAEPEWKHGLSVRGPKSLKVRVG